MKAELVFEALRKDNGRRGNRDGKRAGGSRRIKMACSQKRMPNKPIGTSKSHILCPEAVRRFCLSRDNYFNISQLKVPFPKI